MKKKTISSALLLLGLSLALSSVSIGRQPRSLDLPDDVAFHPVVLVTPRGPIPVSPVASPSTEPTQSVRQPVTITSGTGKSISQDYALSVIGSSQFSCLQPLWERESHWNYLAYNESSGAYGIPQALPGSKMAKVGADWKTNPITQVKWGLGYISGRYDSACNAWRFFRNNGWY